MYHASERLKNDPAMIQVKRIDYERAHTFMKRMTLHLAALAFSIALLGGCAESGDSGTSALNSSLETQQTTTAATEMDTEAPTAAEPASEALCLNPLTGESGYSAEAVGKRPVAVMVNNITASLPQYGIAEADIVYEMVVEGGITRLMAVYADYSSMPDVCSVRSCRYYYPLIALGMDAIYCHWGADQSIAQETLNRTGIDRLDGGGAANGVVFFRDQERLSQYSSEHTGYLDGSAVQTAIENTFGFRTECSAGNAFLFRSEETPEPAQGAVCTTATLSFSSSYFSTFTFDSTSGTYQKQHNGTPHMDSVANTQLAFTNVFALYTPVSLRADNYHMDVGLSGGSGWYLSGGAAQPIHWSKDGEDQPIRIFDESGAELTVNAGKSYIGLIGDTRPVTLE